jgi:hypothetical protein
MNGLPDVLITKNTTVRSLSSVLELPQTFIVQTYRQREQGDTIFIEYIGVEGCLRLALPPRFTSGGQSCAGRSTAPN